jgi:hypothetical protein
LLDVNFIAIEFKESSKDLWSSSLVYLEKENLNKLLLFVVIQVSGELFNVSMLVTKVDKWSWIWKL